MRPASESVSGEFRLALLATVVALCLATPGGLQAAGPPGSPAAASPVLSRGADMVPIPGGMLTPLYRAGVRPAAQGPVGPGSDDIAVAAFRLDAAPVTNEQFLDFVRTHPVWQRSRVKRVFAESGYLSHWAGDTALADPEDADRPVTQVSWFAAKAFCAAEEKALPTTAQWEYAAAASATQGRGEDDPEFVRTVLEWYGRPNPAKLPAVKQGFRNFWGVYDLHGLVWEWTLDFNTALVTGESRADSGLERSLYCGAAAATATSFRDYAAFMRYGYRSSLGASYTVANLGFRCASSLPQLRP